MIDNSTRSLAGAFIAMLGGLLLGVASPSAEAGFLDSLFGKSDPSVRAKADAGRRAWDLHEYTSIRLVPREPDAPPNDHPIEIDPELLRQQLAQIRITGGTSSSTEALFAGDEVAELVEPLHDALAVASPNDDVLLLSSARRAGTLLRPVAVTARLFASGGRLQFIVNDTRYEFYDALQGGRIQPKFTYGSRSRASGATIRSGAAEQKRPDWVALATTATGVQPAVAPATQAQAQPAAPSAAAPAAPAAAAAVAPAPGPAPLRPRDPGFADEVEQRLLTLKRLRDKGLISEEEYQQKRREVLQQL